MAWNPSIPSEGNDLRGASGDIVKMRENFDTLSGVATKGVSGLIGTDARMDTPTSGNYMVFSGGAGGTGRWEPRGAPPGAVNLDDLADVDTTGAVSGDVLMFNGSTWEEGTAGGGGGGFSDPVVLFHPDVGPGAVGSPAFQSPMNDNFDPTVGDGMGVSGLDSKWVAWDSAGMFNGAPGELRLLSSMHEVRIKPKTSGAWCGIAQTLTGLNDPANSDLLGAASGNWSLYGKVSLYTDQGNHDAGPFPPSTGLPDPYDVTAGMFLAGPPVMGPTGGCILAYVRRAALSGTTTTEIGVIGATSWDGSGSSDYITDFHSSKRFKVNYGEQNISTFYLRLRHRDDPPEFIFNAVTMDMSVDGLSWLTIAEYPSMALEPASGGFMIYMKSGEDPASGAAGLGIGGPEMRCHWMRAVSGTAAFNQEIPGALVKLERTTN